MSMFSPSTWFQRKTPEELCKEWRKTVRQQIRQLDREIREIEREERKMKQQIKDLARKKEYDSVKILARSIVRADKAKERIHVTKAQLNSITLKLRQQSASMKMVHAFKTSTELSKEMNKVMSIGKTQKVFYDMAVEMEKAGLIEEIMDDTIDSVMDDGDMDDEIEAQVDQVVSELTMDVLSGADVAPTTIPTEEIAQNGKELFAESLNDTSELEKRLEALHA